MLSLIGFRGEMLFSSALFKQSVRFKGLKNHIYKIVNLSMVGPTAEAVSCDIAFITESSRLKTPEGNFLAITLQFRILDDICGYLHEKDLLSISLTNSMPRARPYTLDVNSNSMK